MVGLSPATSAIAMLDTSEKSPTINPMSLALGRSFYCAQTLKALQTFSENVRIDTTAGNTSLMERFTYRLALLSGAMRWTPRFRTRGFSKTLTKK